MKELIDIVAAYDVAARQGVKTALATVVLVEGSAYRRAGARMLITEYGELTGAISGGCLEGDALRKARMVIMQQEALLVTYDTMDDDDAKLGVGLGCNGIIHILIEPITESTNNPIELLRTVIDSRQLGVVVTLFSLEDRKAPQPGTCLCLAGDLARNKMDESASYARELIADARRVLKNGSSEVASYQAHINYTVFIEYVRPVISLVIVGAGNDAIPLTQLASVLGWDISVVDGRQNYATAARFPLAKRIVIAKPKDVLSNISLNDWTAFVLMTHNYNYEFALLKELLPLNLRYIGVLGPKKKLQRILDELGDSGLNITEDQLDKVHGPVGLDIGSEGAEEISLSIIAEIKAVLSGRKGQSLKFKAVPIHADAVSVTGK
jgi:xanthine/CO dehydrogenase XdhC/CoxF family maturation factor